MIFGRFRVFLSYAREDEQRADALYSSLQAAGFEPWMDRRDIPEGAEWQTEINKAIGCCQAFLACISCSSIRKGGVLSGEVESALERWKHRRRWWRRLGLVLPVRFEACDAPANLATLQWVDVFKDADWVKVAKALRRERRVQAGTVAAMVFAVSFAVLSFAYVALHPKARILPGQAWVGVTLWSLESAAPAPGSKMLLHETGCQGAAASDWKPVRNQTSAGFRPGDHVRVSIESGFEGYLYVVDREMHGPGRLGPPTLIFPTTNIRGGDNFIRPGALAELPDQQDCPPYWTLKSNDPTYSGELLTVLISPKALTEVRAGRGPQVLPPALFEKWMKQWLVPTTSQTNPGEAAATAVELAAGQGSKMLTHEDPLPQTIYRRTDGHNNGSMLAAFPIEIKTP